MCAFQVNDFIHISDSAYSREQILSIEKGILNRLEWNLTVPTVYMFLVRFLKAATLGNKVEKEVNKFRWYWYQIRDSPILCFCELTFLWSGGMQMENMVFFFAELALMQYDLVTRLPSLVAASAVYAARLTLKRAPLWTDTLKHHTGFRESEAELM